MNPTPKNAVRAKYRRKREKPTERYKRLKKLRSHIYC